MLYKLVIFAALCMVHCESVHFGNLTDELNRVVALLSPTEIASFAQLSKACGKCVQYQEEMDQQKVLKLMSIVSNITSDAFDDDIQKIEPLASELIYKRRSKSFFNRLERIIHFIKTDLRRRLNPHQIRHLFRVLNVYSANKDTFVAEGRSTANRTIEQHLLTIASRGMAHALVPSYLLPNVNESAHITLYHNDGWIDGVYNWRSNPNGTVFKPAMYSAWVYTLAVMYQHWIAHYHNASEDIQRTMVQQYHFIPWPSSVIAHLKASHAPVHPKLFFRPRPHWYFELLTKNDYDLDLVRITRFYSDFLTKWALDFFQFQLAYLATNHSDRYRDVWLNDGACFIDEWIVPLAFDAYFFGNDKEYVQLMNILGNPRFCSALQCTTGIIDIVPYLRREELGFKTKSLLRLKVIRGDWNDYELMIQKHILDVAFVRALRHGKFVFHGSKPLIDILNDTLIFGNKTRTIQSIRTFESQPNQWLIEKGLTLDIAIRNLPIFKNAVVRYLNLQMPLFTLDPSDPTPSNSGCGDCIVL
eukprot:905782_1